MVNKWKTVELGDLVTLASGGSFPLKYQSNTNGKYSFFKVSDMNLPINQKYLIESKNTIDEEVKEKLKSKIHPKNTIVFPKVGAALLTNKRRLLVEPSAFDNNIMGIIPNENVDFEYLYYYMLTVDFRKLSQTGAIPSINNTIVSSLPVDLPINKNEQQKIASILSSADKIIRKTEQIIEQSKNVKYGLLEELLKEGIESRKSKEPPVSDIKRTWDLVNLGELFTIKHGFAFKSQYFSLAGKYVLLTPGNFKENGGFKLQGKKQKYYTGDFPESYILDKNDLLVVMTDLTQECRILGSPAYIDKNDTYLHNQRLGKIVDLNNDKIHADYLFYFLNSSYYRKHLKSTATGTTVKHTSPSKIYEVNIPLPGLNEQKEITEILTSVDQKIAIEEEKLRNFKNIKQGLMQQLLTGKVRVPLNENEEVPQ